MPTGDAVLCTMETGEMKGTRHFSDYIIYADESGDHGLEHIDSEYPVFSLALCAIPKKDYVAKVVPAMQQLKFKFWGHDAVVLHEHEIRKNKGPFAILRTDKTLRECFYEDITTLVNQAPMHIFASVINKEKHQKQFSISWNPYEVALYFCMEGLHDFLHKEAQQKKTVYVIFESRGKKEDEDLELAFRRIADNKNQWGYKRYDFSLFDFQPKFMSKASNSSGLQLADLTARPIALSVLRPNQKNRAFDILKPKLKKLKRFP